MEPDLILVDIVYHFVLELDMDLAGLPNEGFRIFSRTHSQSITGTSGPDVDSDNVRKTVMVSIPCA